MFVLRNVYEYRFWYDKYDKIGRKEGGRGKGWKDLYIECREKNLGNMRKFVYCLFRKKKNMILFYFLFFKFWVWEGLYIYFNECI